MKTPWRKNLDPDWIGTYVLPEGEPIVVTIKNVKFEKNITVAGRKQDCHVAYFEHNKWFTKPMLLKPKNLKRLQQVSNSKYIEDWVNIPVTLQQEMDKMPDGSKDYALRINPVKPKIEKPTLNKSIPAWANVVKFLKDGGDINEVEKKYKIGKDEHTALLSEAKQ